MPSRIDLTLERGCLLSSMKGLLLHLSWPSATPSRTFQRPERTVPWAEILELSLTRLPGVCESPQCIECPRCQLSSLQRLPSSRHFTHLRKYHTIQPTSCFPVKQHARQEKEEFPISCLSDDVPHLVPCAHLLQRNSQTAFHAPWRNFGTNFITIPFFESVSFKSTPSRLCNPWLISIRRGAILTGCVNDGSNSFSST